MNTDAVKGFEKLRSQLRSPALRKNIGVRLVELFKEHLRKLEGSRPNQMGFPRQHFWAAAAKSANYRLQGTDGLQVVISADGYAQRVYGGIIKPTNVKALTIPVNAEAYGRRATTFTDLYFIPIHRGNVVGVLARRNSAAKNSSVGEAFYLLLKQVKQKPDPSAAPSEGQIDEAVRKQLNRAFNQS